MTPILQTLIPLVTSYGTHKAVQFLEGAEELALPDDDLTSFLARRAVEWDQLETADQDSLRDAYLEAIKWECARRLAKSDPVPVAKEEEVLVHPAKDVLDRLRAFLQEKLELALAEKRAWEHDLEASRPRGAYHQALYDVSMFLKSAPIAELLLHVDHPHLTELERQHRHYLPASTLDGTETPYAASRLFKPITDRCPACGLVGAHFCTGGQASHPGWSASASSLPVSAAQAALVERMQDLWKKCRNVGSGNSVCHEINVIFPQIMPLVLKALSEPSPASSAVPAPLVPEVVKTAQEGSVCEVEPLREAISMAVDALSWAMALIDHEAKEWNTTNGYQIATNTLAGLRKALHAHESWSPPSSEDKELLDWLNEKIVSLIELDDFALIDVRGNCVREAIRAARSKEAQQASTTPQKGEQGV